jgi:bifunctional non-homologous end joining protein LigD
MARRMSTALPARGRDRETWTLGRRSVEVTHLDKVFWPESGLTKGDLLRYYRDVAPTLLPYMQGRPFIMRAWPDGITGDSFYRWRRPDYAPRWLGHFRYRVHATGRTAEMLVVDDPAELIWVVNQGVIEMHPWLGTTRNIERPTWMVFDLDPAAGGPFEEALHVAELIERALEALGLRGVAKTTGGRGVHVFVAIEKRYTFEDVRGWLRAFLDPLAASHPDTLTLDKRLSDRKGKVMVDYSQNAAGKSIAAPYSIRARPGAPVSTPLAWDEVSRGRVRPTDFTLTAVLSRLRERGDLFAPILAHAYKLPRFTSTRRRESARKGGRG